MSCMSTRLVPDGVAGGLRLPAVDVLLRPAALGLAPQRPHASAGARPQRLAGARASLGLTRSLAGALVVWAGQPNISSVVQRAAERCGLVPPPRAPSTPLPDDDADDDAPQPRAAPPADAFMACGDEPPQEASQEAMALD